VAGEIVTGRLVRLACQRHLRDLKTGKRRGIYFDPEAADHAIRFIELYLYHWKDPWAGRRFLLSPWQKFIVGSLFGWRRADGTRRFRKVYIGTGKKTGKSALAAAIALYMLVADGERGAEVYSTATKQEQARCVWEAAMKMVKRSPELRQHVQIYRDSLAVEETDSKFLALGADSDTLDGNNVYLAIIDEYHAHKTPGVYDVMNSSTVARDQPMVFVITTAGYNINGPCHQEEQYCIRVLEGIATNDEYFIYIAQLDEKDDWTDEAVWQKANPNIGITVDITKYREACQEAIDQPRKQNEFRCKQLNQWMQQQVRWIPYHVWQKGAGHVSWDLLKGRECWAGLDLSANIDITALVLWFPPAPDTDEKHRLLPFFWLPGEDLRERSLADKVDYEGWAREGYVDLCPGYDIDDRYVALKVVELAKEFHIREVVYDPHGARATAKELMEHGFEIVEMPQNLQRFSPPSKEFERLVTAGRVNHGGNPVLTWMMDCTDCYTNPTGLIRPVKPNRQKSGKRIDGIVAAIMALSRAMTQEAPERAHYEDNEILVG